MSKKTRDEISDLIKAAKMNMDVFYNQPFVNYKGTTFKNEGDEFYTEIICEWLLAQKDNLSLIKRIKRQNSYKVHTIDNKDSRFNLSSRIEEKIGMELWENRTIPSLGKILDYQVPLKNIQSDKVGKIDILSFDEEKRTIRILELKRPGNDETLLRCVLESYTYSKIVCEEKLIKDFKILGPLSIKACPLFFKDNRQYQEYEQVCHGMRPNLKRLMKLLKIELVMLSTDEQNSTPLLKQYKAEILPY
ncbi:MAG: hypothetical protein AB9828_00955 [Sphaerochaetaceae bacterium]